MTQIVLWVSLAVSGTSFFLSWVCHRYTYRNIFKPGTPVKFLEYNTRTNALENTEGVVVHCSWNYYEVWVANHQKIRSYKKLYAHERFSKRDYVIYDAANQRNITFKPS